MASRGRPAGFSVGEQHRLKIAKSNVLNRFIKAACGQISVTPTDATLLIAAVKKIVPDLAAIEHTGDVQTSYIVRMPAQVSTLEEWNKQYTAADTEQSQQVSSDPTLTTH